VLRRFAADAAVGALVARVAGEKAAYVADALAAAVEAPSLPEWAEGCREGDAGGKRVEEDESSGSLRWDFGVDMCVSQGVS
jgi:hypothetical protein